MAVTAAHGGMSASKSEPTLNAASGALRRESSIMASEMSMPRTR
jgi:hypothetical protein